MLEGAVPSGTVASGSPVLGSSAPSVAARDRRVAIVDRLGAAVADQQQRRPRRRPRRAASAGEDEQSRDDGGRGRRPAVARAAGGASTGSCSRMLALEPLQALARLQPELLGERQAALLVDVQRLGLAVRAVEREHELAAQPLAQRMPRDERLELADELGVAAEREIGLDPLFERRELQLVEARDLRLCERLVGEVGKRRGRARGRAPARSSSAASLRLALGSSAARLLEHVRGSGPRRARRARP